MSETRKPTMKVEADKDGSVRWTPLATPTPPEQGNVDAQVEAWKRDLSYDLGNPVAPMMEVNENKLVTLLLALARATPTNAVAQARDALERRIQWVWQGTVLPDETRNEIDDLIAAVRAEYAAKVREMDAHVAPDDQSLFLWRDDVLAALEAKA